MDRTVGSPLISVGIPVFNGERYLRQAILSVLTQTVTDLELVISDNASEDGTQRICEELAASDDRIRYYRQPRNLGAAPNLNFVFERSRGHYFKWLAHDDACEPRFLEASLDALRSPGTVLACPRRIVVDADGSEIRRESFGRKLATTSPSAQFGSILQHDSSLVVLNFGLMRRPTVARTKLYGSHYGSDWPFLADMALRGRFVEVEEDLFVWRRHPEQFGAPAKHRLGTRLTLRSVFRDPNAVAEVLWKASFWNTSTALWRQVPYWRRLGRYVASVFTRRLRRNERLRCLRHIGGWIVRGRRLLVRDLLIALALLLRRSR